MKSPGINTQAYFDCNATTPVLPAAAEAAFDAMRTLYGNPSSSHLVGIQAKSILESTRKLAAKVVNADPGQIIFTSGATEAVQTAVFSVLQHHKASLLSPGANSKKTEILYGATEHKVIPECLRHWVKALELPIKLVELPVDSQGQILMGPLREHLPNAILLCTMAVNNETGVIQNTAAIEAVLNELNSQALWLVDCVQALGKFPLNLKSTRIDYAPFSGHKLYAPKGIGFLYVRKSAPLVPLIVGGGQENGLRSGTENLPGVAALGAVLEQLTVSNDQSVFHSHERLLEFRSKLITELKRAFPKVEFNTPFEISVPTTINFSVPGLTSAELLDLFDSAGLRLSAGSACSSSSSKPSHVLDAMGVPEWRSISALRLSFGPFSTEKEIKRGCHIIRECAIALQNTCLLDTARGFEAPENLRDGIVQFRAGSTNSWLIADRYSRKCIIIDPCETIAARLEHYVRCQHLEVLGILDTHSHADHASIRPELLKILSDQVAASGQTLDPLGWPQGDSNLITRVQLDDGSFVPAIRINLSDRGELVLARVRTPGHTDDSHSLLLGFAQDNLLKKELIHFAFPGDTILSGGLGRTNFSFSDPVSLFNSLRIFQNVISSATLLCPAHDYNNSFATSLKTELKENPLLSLALSPMTNRSLDSFLTKKKELDKELASLEETFQGVVCGVTPVAKAPGEVLPVMVAEGFQEYIKENPNALVIDVREPQEYSLFKNWSTIGLDSAPRNVPLSRFVNLIGELIESQKNDQSIFLICKTGRRSLQAAQSLRRLGFDHAWSLEGGISHSSMGSCPQ